MRMIIVSGMPGSGKEELLSSARGLGYPFVRMGDLVREYYSDRPEEDRELSMGEFAGKERSLHGSDIWARRAFERMSGSLFLVDGCRSMDEVKAFRGLGETVIVAVHAPPGIRYERLVKRGREDAPSDIGEFMERDRRELSWGVGEVISLCDRILDNSGTLEDFHNKASDLLRSLE